MREIYGKEEKIKRQRKRLTLRQKKDSRKRIGEKRVKGIEKDDKDDTETEKER